MSFGIANNVRSEVRVCTPELLDQALDSVQVARTCAEIEDALEKCRRGELNKEDFETLKGELKKRLPIATFHATFKHGRRKNEEAIPSGLCIYDLDHIPNPRAKWAEIEARKEELGIVMAHITPSTEGLRLVFIVPRGMSLAEAQAWMASMLGDTQYDACVKDYARCSFLVPREYVLFLSEGLFETTGVIQRNEETKNLNTQSGCKQTLRDAQDDKDNGPQDDKTSYPETYEGIPYPKIVETLEEQMGGRPEHGSRNNFIFSMACHLRYICNDDPDWIASILPTYGEARDKWMASIRSACARNQMRSFPNIMKRTLSVCKQSLRYALDDREGDEDAPLGNQKSEIRNHKSEIPEMPAELPPLIELLTSKVPAPMKPAVAHAVFPPMGAHLGGVKFRYVDNTLREATFMCCLMAKMSSGKSAVNKPIEYILADIVERDEENRRREQNWKDSINQKGANKEKPKRPEGLCIQVLVSDMTNAAFVQRLSDANGKFLYTSMDELELMNQLKTSARGNQVSQIIRLAFDCGLYGQERVGTSSVTARVKVRWNWNASSTIQRGCQFFRNALSDGTLSRLNICSIEPQTDGEIPVYGTYDETFAEALKPYIDHLNEATGLVECKEAEDLARQLLKENAETALLSDDEVYESLSYRANVIAYLKAMTLYVANGCVWDKRFEDFIRWSEQYDLYYKMRFFGESMKLEMEKENWVNQRGPQNMLNYLPDRFTTADAVEVRRQLGKDGNVKPMLKTWVHRGYICKDECTGEFYKTKKHPDSRS